MARGGKKFGKRELANKEQEARDREPLMILREQEKMSKQKTAPQGMRRAGKADPRSRGKGAKGQLAWVSPEAVDLDKVMRGEETIDYSKGQWVTDGGLSKEQHAHLIDHLLRYGTTDRLHKLTIPEPPRIKLLTAQRFMLDHAASQFYGSVVMDWGKQALLQHEMARAPYELCWIEVDSLAYASIVPSTQMQEPSDVRVGYLYDHGTVWIASETQDYREAAWLPYQLSLHTPVSAEFELEMAEFFRVDVPLYRALLLGNLGDAGQPIPIDKEWLMGPEVTALVRGHRFEIPASFRALMQEQRVNNHDRQKMLQSCAGIVKQIIILLLLLTRPNKHVYFGEAAVPAKRVWIGNRQVPTVSYNKVTMHLEQKDALRRLNSEVTGVHRKEHDVREHWCQSRRKGRGCEHKFILLDPKHGECEHGCGAKIWWKKPHKRGDIRLGSVSKTYEVTQ